jgi:DNA-binding transcriptional MocR family regulator
MSYIDSLNDLTRGGESSLTQQVVDVFKDAIEAGELAPGERLPSTRELAELAGINHLTAVRCYRRLRELGLVSAHVGRGTFVSGTAPAAGSEPGTVDWQTYALPEYERSAQDRAVSAMLAVPSADELIPLAIGFPDSDVLPTDGLREATEHVLREHGPAGFQYSAVEGVETLREELAGLSSEDGAPAEAADIVVTSGARQAMTLVARAVLRPGDVAVIEAPGYMGGIEALRDAGARIIGVPYDSEGLDIDHLERVLARHDVRMVCLQSRLQNPTGNDMSPERARRLIALARRHGFFVMDDEVYAPLRFEGEAPPPLRALAPELVIGIDSLSKTVCPGLRLGWVVAHGPVYERICREKRHDDLHTATLAQLIIARYLASGSHAAQRERVIAHHLERRDALLAALDSKLADQATWSRPKGGGHVWVTLNRPLPEPELSIEAARLGVSYVPGQAMLPERPERTHMRLTYCYLDPGAIIEGVGRLRRAIDAVGRVAAPAASRMPVL